MKKLTLLAASAAALVTVAAAGAASAETYINLGYTSVDADPAKVATLTGRVGWTSTIFGLEGEGGFGVKDDTVSGVKIELKHSLAAYATVRAPLSDAFSLHARAGFGSVKFEASALGVKTSDSESTTNYGVGATFMLNPTSGVRADWTKYDFDGGDADTWSIAYVHKFQ